MLLGDEIIVDIYIHIYIYIYITAGGLVCGFL